MKKKIDSEKLFMGALIAALCIIFVVLFTYGLSSVLAMEGTMPPNILAEGLTPAPATKQEALDLLNKAVSGAVAGKPKLDTADNFDIDTDTFETSGSEELKTAMLYAVDEFDSQLDSNFESVSTDFGEEIADKINIPAITVDDILDFTCDYIYYKCPSCDEDSSEPHDNCELCGGVYPYNMKYRDEYTVTLTVAANEKTLGGNFSQRTPDEAKALLGDKLDDSASIEALELNCEELKIVYRVNRLTDKLTYLDYSKKTAVKATAQFLGKFKSLGTADVSFMMNENDSFSFT